MSSTELACEVAVDRLSVMIAGRDIVDAVSLDASPGALVAIVGPNGCGKTTLLRAVYRAQAPSGGSVWIDDHDVWAGRARDSALLTAMVAQVEGNDFEFTVRESVSLGRVPHHSTLRPRTTSGDGEVDASLSTAGAAHLAHRLTSTLSGGERQRVAVARALAQRTPVIVLDEPTNHLDVRAQIELLDLLTSLPATVLVVLHDLNLAAAYADQVFVMASGRIVADGPPTEVLSPALIADVYGVAAHCSTNPLTGRPALHFASPSTGTSTSTSSQTKPTLTETKEKL